MRGKPRRSPGERAPSPRPHTPKGCRPPHGTGRPKIAPGTRRAPRLKAGHQRDEAPPPRPPSSPEGKTERPSPFSSKPARQPGRSGTRLTGRSFSLLSLPSLSTSRSRNPSSLGSPGTGTEPRDSAPQLTRHLSRPLATARAAAAASPPRTQARQQPAGTRPSHWLPQDGQTSPKPPDGSKRTTDAPPGGRTGTRRPLP